MNAPIVTLLACLAGAESILLFALLFVATWRPMEHKVDVQTKINRPPKSLLPRNVNFRANGFLSRICSRWLSRYSARSVWA